MPTDVNAAVSELRMESLSTSPVSAPTNPQSTSRFAGARVHFIGIGGSGMSGLARMLLDAGAIVTGSELSPNLQTFALVDAGAKVSRDQNGEYLSKDINLVVHSAAIKDDNLELISARALGIETIKYARLLGLVMEERFGIAVSGTHGKSTTTAMIAHALIACGADPSFVVGGTVPQLGGGSRSGKGNAFVAEACEFDRSFHNLRPKVALILNIEEDHLDCYKNIVEIVASFHTFASSVPLDGLIIANAHDPHVSYALDSLSTPVELVSLAEGFAWSTRVTSVEDGCYRGEVYYKGIPVALLRLGIPGEHNLFNATMALAACNTCGVDLKTAAEAISNFQGVDRRMTEVGHFRGATIVDDYGHHPTEIRATLKAVKDRYHPRKLFCVFQPHQHSRTRFLLDHFAESFALADETIVPDIYFVRDSEEERKRITAEDLVARITANGQSCRHLPDFASITDFLRENVQNGDVVLTMGAGNVFEIGRELLA